MRFISSKFFATHVFLPQYGFTTPLSIPWTHKMRATSALAKRCESWNHDTTYHPVHDDFISDKKALININISHITDDTREQPKIALRKRISLSHPLVHLLPVIVTIGIVQLSFRQVDWDDVSRFDTGWPNFLQFPAKLHEILIVGSLSAMVLHIFRRMLVGPHGIPLGLMVGAFQIGSAEYLISKSYVKPLRHSFFHHHYKAFFVALALGSAIIYSFLVGPASAGALIPTLDWWNVAKPFNNSLALTSYIQRTPSELHPMKLDLSDVNQGCRGDNWNTQSCPGEGYSQLSDWQWTRYDEGWEYGITRGEHNNPTMINTFSRRSRREIVTRLAVSNNSSMAASLTATLQSSVLALTDSFWHWVSNDTASAARKPIQPRLITSRNTPVYIPLVQVQCNPVDYAKARLDSLKRDHYVAFDTANIISNFYRSSPNTYSKSEWTVPNNLLNFTRPLDETNVTWVDSSDIEGPQGTLNASLAAIVTVPHVASGKQGSLISPCVIDARWVSTDVRFDPKTDDIVGTSFTDWLASADLSAADYDVKSAPSRWDISKPISISADWATALNAEAPPSNGKYRDSTVVEHLLLQFVASESGTNGKKKILNFGKVDHRSQNYSIESVNIAVTLSAVMADWLSRSTFGNISLTTWLSEPKDGNVSTVQFLPGKELPKLSIRPVSDFDVQTPFIFKVQRYGWGYGLRSGTIWFSIITLLIHAVLVLVHFSYSFVFFFYQRNGWTSGAWGSIGELVALANTSPPANELKNSGAGISRSKTWMTRLRIREASSDPDRVELVVGNKGGTIIPDDNLLKTSKEYA
ncbi:hypothetical protein F4801DRAFT_546444 [Xylaria longipes]|nr:hypothetical protein F4801DRAFT_546444 [Xylaria longipes]